MARKESRTYGKPKKAKSSNKSGGKLNKNSFHAQHAGAASISGQNQSAEIFPSSLLSRSQKTNVLESLVPSSVFVAKNFFTESECLAWVEYSEQQIGFEQIDSPRTRDYAHRECGRIQKTDWNLAATLFDRMGPMMNEIANCHYQLTGDKSYKPVGCNGDIRIYKYEKGMSFGRHYDGAKAIDRFADGATEMTVLIYLSSCRGGATRFHLPHQTGGRGKKSKKGTEGIAFVPEAGSILMHMHGERCLAHEADPVIEGIKYVLRTDIVFATT